MQGLLDFVNSPEGRMGLLQFGAGMMQPTMGGNFGEAFGRGLQGGVQGYGNALHMQDQRQQRELLKQQREMQIAQLQKRQDVLSRIGKPASMAPTVANAQNPQIFDQNAALQALLTAGDLEGAQALHGMRPKDQTLPWYVRKGSDGALSIDPAYSELEKAKASFARPPAQPMQPVAYVDRNGNTVWGTINDARGRPAANYSPAIQGAVAAAKGAGAEGGKSGIEMNVKLYDNAIKAEQALPKVNELISLLESGNVHTGMAADIRLGIDRARSLLGGVEGAKRASDTQIADVLMGGEVFPLIQSLGIGARGMDTPAEREFMRQVLTGTISLEKDTLLKMANMRRRTFENSINRYNEKVDSGELDTFFDTTQIRKAKLGSSPAKQNNGWSIKRK